MAITVPGLAAALETAMAGMFPPGLLDLPEYAGFKEGNANFANTLASAIVPYLLANIVVQGVATGVMPGAAAVPVIGTIT